MAKRGKAIERLRAFVPKGVERYVEGLPHFHPPDIERIVSAVGIPLTAGRVTVHVEDGGSPAERTIERSEALRQKLDAIAMWYEIEAREQERPDIRDVRDALGDVGKHAEALLRALSVIPQLPKESQRRTAQLNLEKTAAPLPVDFERMDYSIRARLQNRATICAEKPDGLGSLNIFRTRVAGDKFENQTAARTALHVSVEAVALLRNWAREAQATSTNRIEPAGSPGRRADEALNGLFGNLKGLWMEIWERAPTASRPKLSRASQSAGGPFFRFCRIVSDHLDLRLTDDGIYDRLRMATRRRRKRREGKIPREVS